LRARNGYYGLHARLYERFGILGDTLLVFATCTFTIATSGFAAYAFKQPLFFPSLGPTVYLLCESPMAPMSSPRNTIIGHFVAVIVGGISLAVFGLLGTPSVMQVGVSLARISVGALSVACTGAILLLLRASHPPAGATVLIVSLGFLQTPQELIALMAGVVILTVAGWLTNRALGVPVPVWSANG
jgi:CBS domain-containing membrane protein